MDGLAEMVFQIPTLIPLRLAYPLNLSIEKLCSGRRHKVVHNKTIAFAIEKRSDLLCSKREG